MIKVILGLVLAVALSSLAFGMQTPSVYAIKTINNNSTGGDCQLASIGTWDAATNTCTLTSDLSEGIVLGYNGITLDGNGHTISGSSTSDGVLVKIKTNITIKNLIIQNFGTGINIDNSIGVTLSGNTISNSNGAGISSTASSNIVLTSNTLSNNNGGISVSNTQGTTLTSNTVSNDKGSVAIMISSSGNAALTSNTVTSNGATGIETMYGSDGATLTSNTVSNNGGIGIYIVSSNNIVTKNTISNNVNTGIYVSGSAVQITHNIISNNLYGINSGYAATVYDNTISGNNVGILPSGGSYYNNNLINNAVQVSNAFGSTFSLNPPIGGNYWTDYSPTCTNANGDSFCDTAYPFSGGTVGVVDNYPWTIQNGWHTVITTGGDLTTTVVGNATSKAVSYTASATQDSSPVSVICTPSSGSLFQIGKTMVICTASTGVKASFAVTVQQQDAVSPVVTVPSNQVVTATSSSGAIVNYPTATATDNVGVTSGPTCTPSSGSMFPIGHTIVTCTASDAAGNVGKASFTVTVNAQQTTTSLITTNTDKSSYTFGDTIIVSGTVASVVPGTPISIQIFDPNNSVVQTSQISVSSDGTYSNPISITGSYWTLNGIYTLAVQYGPPNVKAQTTFTFSNPNIISPTPAVPPPSTNALTAATDRSSYSAGDSIIVSGTVNQINSVNPQQPVTIQTYDVHHELVRIDQAVPSPNGQYSIAVPAHGPMWQSTGIYTLKIQYDQQSSASELTFYFDSGTLSTPTPIPQTQIDVNILAGAGSSANAACVAANNCFSPNVLNVATGTTVTWKNTDSVSHTITSGHVTDDNAGSLFDSGLIKSGNTFQFTFANGGAYDYLCTVHPWMTGKVIVGSIHPVSVPIQNTGNEVDIQAGAGSSANAACVTTNNCFSPNPLSVSLGTEVDWKNGDTISHTVTSGKVTDDNSGIMFDSGLIKKGADFKYTFENAGTYDYFCTVHPWMVGQVIVGSGISTTPHLLTNPTQQDLSNIDQAKTSQTIAAEVNVGNDKTETKSIDSSVSVQTTSSTSDSLGVKVSAPDQTGPKVIVFNLNATTINVANLKDLGVEYDGKLISPAPNMDAILHAKSTDNPSFAIVVTQSGVQVMVLVPHFSTHTITLTNMSKVIPVVPEFPFAMFVLIIAIFSVVIISKIKSVRNLHAVF